MPVINFNQFKNLSGISGTGVRYSHKLSRGTFIDSPGSWICKEMPSPEAARIELLSQEFFRLIIPHQPRTKIARNFVTGTYFILSEEIDGYRNLPIGTPQNFANGTFTGLGQVLVCSMFLQEIDLKNGNIGLNNRNQVLKIDGDWCFAEDRWGGIYNLTPESIASLPYPAGFYTFNWLDLTINGVKQHSHNIINQTLTHSAQFRNEVNQAILKICLIPDSFIDRFVDTYIPAGAQRYIDLIKTRRNALKKSALSNPSFLAYLHTRTANEDAKNILDQMLTFKDNNRPVIPADLSKTVEKDFGELLKPFSTRQFNQKSIEQFIFDECQGLLHKIQQSSLGKHDIFLKNYIDKHVIAIADNSHNPGKLLEIKQEMNVMLKSVNSPEVLAVRETIKSLRKNANFFTIGMNNKASIIEMALSRTPLAERGKIISSKKINSVQQALAMHRHLGKRGDVYMDGEKIDMKRSARSFIELKKRFPSSDNNLPNNSVREPIAMRM